MVSHGGLFFDLILILFLFKYKVYTYMYQISIKSKSDILTNDHKHEIDR